MHLPKSASLMHRTRTGKHTRTATPGASWLLGHLGGHGSKNTGISHLLTLSAPLQSRLAEKAFLQRPPYAGKGRGKPNPGNSEIEAPSWNLPTKTSQHLWKQPRKLL